MKKKIVLGLILTCAVGLFGCSGKQDSGMANGMSDSSKVEEDLTEESYSEMISSDELGPGIYARLQEDWEEWNAKSEMERMLSSRMPGHIYMRFDTWASCEEFLGFEIYNPLEDSEFEKGTFVGMPEGFNDASRFYISFGGTEEGEVQWISVDSGYRDGDIRITVQMSIRPDKPLEIEGEQMITEDSGERYVATSKTVVLGPVCYNIRVIGEENQWKEVRETLAKVLPYFEED